MLQCSDCKQYYRRRQHLRQEGEEQGARSIPLRLKKAYEALRRRTRANAVTPNTTSTRVAPSINSEETGGPPVSASAVGVGLAVALAVGVAAALSAVSG